MWANAQRDGRPAEHRWCRLFNAANFGWRSLLDCRVITLQCQVEKAVEISWGPQTGKLISAASRPKFTILWGHPENVLLLNNFFSDCRCVPQLRRYIARQSCAMVPRWRFLATFLRPVFSASRVQHVSDLHPNFALRPYHVWKYGRHWICDGWDRRGKDDEEEEEETTAWKYNRLPYSICDHNQTKHNLSESLKYVYSFRLQNSSCYKLLDVSYTCSLVPMH